MTAILVRIEPNNMELIGKKLRLPGWRSCFLLVRDVGSHYIIGTIIDEEGRALVHEARPFNEAWEIVK